MTNDLAHGKLVIYFVCEAIMQSVRTLPAGNRFKTSCVSAGYARLVMNYKFYNKRCPCAYDEVRCSM